jgi:hypothetical protein
MHKKRTKLMIFNSKNMMFVGILIAASLISMGAPAMAIEEPSYRILETEGEFELRKYSHRIRGRDLRGRGFRIGRE